MRTRGEFDRDVYGFIAPRSETHPEGALVPAIHHDFDRPGGPARPISTILAQPGGKQELAVAFGCCQFRNLQPDGSNRVAGRDGELARKHVELRMSLVSEPGESNEPMPRY